MRRVVGPWPRAPAYAQEPQAWKNAVFRVLSHAKTAFFLAPEFPERLRRRPMAYYPSHAALAACRVKRLSLLKAVAWRLAG